MLKNYIGNYPKCVLIIDNVKLERLSGKLVSNWTGGIGQSSLANLLSAVVSDPFQPDRPIFTADIMQYCVEQTILLPVAELSQLYSASAIFQLLRALKRNPKIRQIYVWATVNSISNEVLVPFLEHMANVVVTLKDFVNLSVLTKKTGGSVVKKLFSYQIASDDISVLEVKQELAVKVLEPSIDPESLATFKINFEDEELEARNALKLPYEKTSVETPASGRIIYSPDSDDDFDEEDPDDDLDI